MPFQRPLILSFATSIFKDRADLVAENVALRHQLSCLIHRGSRPKLRPVDRAFWAMLSRIWDGWRESLIVVKPSTVLAWRIVRGSNSSGGGRAGSVVSGDLEFPSKFVG